MIRKIGVRKYGLYSLKTHRRLGVFSSREAAVKRERQIQAFKHMGKSYSYRLKGGRKNGR